MKRGLWSWKRAWNGGFLEQKNGLKRGFWRWHISILPSIVNAPPPPLVPSDMILQLWDFFIDQKPQKFSLSLWNMTDGILLGKVYACVTPTVNAISLNVEITITKHYDPSWKNQNKPKTKTKQGLESPFVNKVEHPPSPISNNVPF